MIAVIGLGNPGPTYESTRHNIGFMVLDELAARLHIMSWRDKFNGSMAKVRFRGQDVLLLKPMTYMNESGQSVQAAMRFFRIEPTDLLVVHDELDLPFREIRLKVGGGHAGHNGLRSIIKDINSPQFNRLRMGIGKPPRGHGAKGADYVLGGFNAQEKAELDVFVTGGADAVELVLDKGVAAVSNRLNRRPKEPKNKQTSQSSAEKVGTDGNTD